MAAVNCGYAFIEASPQSGYPPLDFNVLAEGPVTIGKSFEARVEGAKEIVELIKKHKPDLVGLEDYAARVGQNTTLIQYAELSSLVKYMIYELDIPIIVTPPTTFRSWIGVKSGSKKDVIMSLAYEKYGFHSKASRKNERSNATDAFCHAYIAAEVFFAGEGKLSANLKPNEKKAIYGDSKKMVGQLNRGIIKKGKRDGERG